MKIDTDRATLIILSAGFKSVLQAIAMLERNKEDVHYCRTKTFGSQDFQNLVDAMPEIEEGGV